MQIEFSLVRASTVVTACLATVVVNAGSLQDGKNAYLNEEYNTAYEILLPLAEQGHPEAQVIVGVMFDRGQGVPVDSQTAVQWFTKAAQQGNAEVQHDLGVKYYRGTGIPANNAMAVMWWRKAAESGIADSAYNLGLMYSRGLGVAQNDNEAVRWFRQAAQQGHARAQYSLAVMYAFGQGLEKDHAEAARWLRKSADQGIAEAQFNLGLLLESGIGVPVDRDEAHQWFQKAAEQGVPQAVQKLASLKETPTLAAGNAAAWLASQNPQHYTLQLMSLESEDTVTRFLAGIKAIAASTGYVRYAVKDEIRFAVLYGAYATFAEAESAGQNLPASLQSYKPWVRRIGHLQTLDVP